MFKKIKGLLIGKSLKSEELEGEKYSVLWGLPILSSDAISSVAYACEEILLVLIPVLAMNAYKPLLIVVLGIVILLMILVFSYRQTIDCYPHGGGSYIVATDNLGKIPGLVAAASLGIDYILTVAVSTCAGTAALTSAIPELLPYTSLIALLLIGVLMVGNLRGMRESAVLFGLPTYLFIIAIVTMVLTGIFKVVVLKEMPSAAINMQASGDLGILLLLKAFASGCTALTGVEAVSDGVCNFKEPSQKNAKRVLGLLALLAFIIFVGVSFLATMYHIVPQANVTVIAQIAALVFNQDSLMFYGVQITTMIILVMAANTAFADLPLLLSILAKDGYVPRQFMNRGSRLSFSNGIIMLGVLSGLLVIIFGGSTHHLMPLYAVGVFLSFTLSQAGMFIRWLRLKPSKWHYRAFVNGLGMVITGITCIIIAVSKFVHGSWAVLICILALLFLMLKVKRHYSIVTDDLAIVQEEIKINQESKNGRIILPIDNLNRSFIKALNYAYSLQSENIEIFHVDTDHERTLVLQNEFKNLNLDAKLIVREAPFRNINEEIIKYIEECEYGLKNKEKLTVIIPQFVTKCKWQSILHNQTSLVLKLMLMKHRNVVVISVPYLLKN